MPSPSNLSFSVFFLKIKLRVYNSWRLGVISPSPPHAHSTWAKPSRAQHLSQTDFNSNSALGPIGLQTDSKTHKPTQTCTKSQGLSPTHAHNALGQAQTDSNSNSVKEAKLRPNSCRNRITTYIQRVGPKLKPNYNSFLASCNHLAHAVAYLLGAILAHAATVTVNRS